MQSNTISRAVQVWLFIGVVMVFFQVVLGGVTRLTDSGLSITEWNVIQGTLPPMNEAEWQTAFEQYKQAAKKQYETLHADMTLSEFKVIFFWEYFHRLWARTMGFVFLFPFVFFVWKKRLPGWLLKNLGWVIGLASLAAIFGWIMVKSGLNNDQRTWVSAYKLATHLSIATALFGVLFWTWLRAFQPEGGGNPFPELRRFSRNFIILLCLQIVFGGLMAGMRAGLIHPHFPFFVEGQRLIHALSATAEVNVDGVVDYESGIFMKGVAQVLHRLTAWALFILGTIFYFRLRQMPHITPRLRLGANLQMGMLGLQFLLGVLTIINCIGKVPLFFGAVHQAGALVLLAIALFVNYQFSAEKNQSL
ncbi:MAG: heme A synthase [Bacteroidetes bacterium]|nr:MAG: heme A synthase [Bacteroidota bacterium]